MKNYKKIKKIISYSFLATIFLFISLPALAGTITNNPSLTSNIDNTDTIQSSLSSGLIPEATGTTNCAGLSATECGDYEISDFMTLATNIARWVLGIVGTLTLVMFCFGGFMFLISAGSSEKISQANEDWDKLQKNISWNLYRC
jgi:hypothetical protein